MESQRGDGEREIMQEKIENRKKKREKIMCGKDPENIERERERREDRRVRASERKRQRDIKIGRAEI